MCETWIKQNQSCNLINLLMRSIGKNNIVSNNKHKDKDLPLVPETILKRRHNLDELRARREAKGPKKSPYVKRKEQGLQLIKPESLLAHAKSRHNVMKRCRRVRTKGMQNVHLKRK